MKYTYYIVEYPDKWIHVIRGPENSSIRDAMAHIPSDPIRVEKSMSIPNGYFRDVPLAEGWTLYS